ncbi:hypothetical protein CXF68_12305 [Tenacibaculum sp. Bg11-29]|uniref:hypothetical protein n=1 Tax=Tenacibaculum sp. Bg11-29 TaxID=2058306 RepID=UPI000C336E8E|nr:hypothetical protein [Tenacibaculum sp. Bg11-29]PKH51414.1 hypothetical protein CXF68_12305 [Tenacibaculum sp. Bg11-29]
MNKIKFIEQPYHSKKCGQACLSMVTGKSIDEVCTILGKKWSTCIESDLQTLLNKEGYKTTLIRASGMKLKAIPNNSIVLLSYPNETRHFVLKSADKIYDPSVGVIDQMLAYIEVLHYLTFEKS